MPDDPRPTGAEPAPTPSIPTEIPPYHILSELGSGGMGTVYLAEQRAPIRRRVALKVIKLGMDTKAVLARFEAERQALALMDHGSIAKVLDAGVTPQGQPFFAMEYVKGVPITRYCDDHRLSLEDRLALFKQVCSGVQHAHTKGVIHRDLTPNNVLVTAQDGAATAKIIDFGLARATDHKLTEKTVFTEQGVILGTPEYMSPEQAGLDALDVDMRSDVYTLGVLLYELLTGSVPFSREQLRRAGFDKMCAIIRSQEPERPSTKITKSRGDTQEVAQLRRTDSDRLLRRLRGDLDWVVLKCLEKDRTRRYETVSQLAEDVQRHLGHEPVRAHAPSLRYRFGKLARRYRAQLIAAATILLVLVAGLAGTTWFWLEARTQTGIAETNATKARDETLRAQAQEQLAQQRATEAEAHRNEKERALAATEGALRRETGMRLGALATLHAGSNPGLAIAFADAGCEHTPSAESERALRGALSESRELATTYLWERTAAAETLGFARSSATADTDPPATLVSADLGVVVALDFPAAGSITSWSLREGAAPQRSVARLGDFELVTMRTVLAPRGDYLGVATKGGALAFRTDSGAAACEIASGARSLAAIGFDGAGRRLIVAWEDGTVTLADVAARSPETPLLAGATRGPATAIVAARDAGRVLLRIDEAWELHDLDARARIARIEAPNDCASLAPDGTAAVAWNAMDGVVVTWDPARGRREMADPTQLRVTSGSVCSALSPDHRLLAFDCGAGTLQVWDLEAGRPRHTLESRDGAVVCVAFADDSRSFVIGCENGVLRVFDCDSGTERLALQGHTARVLCARFDGEDALLSCAADGTVRRWTLTRRVGRRSATPAELHRLLDVFSPVDGSVFELVKGVEPRLCAIEPGRVFRDLPIVGVDDPVALLLWIMWPSRFTPDGAHVVGNDPFGSGMGSWVIATAELQKQRPIAIGARAASPDGRWLVGVKDGLALASVVDEAPSSPLEASGGYNWPRFGPDGQHVIATGTSPHVRSRESQTARIWTVATRRVVSTFTSPDESLLTAAIAPGAKLAAGAGDDGGVPLWEVESGEALATLRGHHGKVYALAFSDDGRRLASGGRDGTVRVWDVAARREVACIQRPNDIVMAVAFSADGEWVLFGTSGGEVAAEPVDARAFVAKHGLRPLTPAECEHFAVYGEAAQAEYRAGWRKRFGLDAPPR